MKYYIENWLENSAQGNNLSTYSLLFSASFGFTTSEAHYAKTEVQYHLKKREIIIEHWNHTYQERKISCYFDGKLEMTYRREINRSDVKAKKKKRNLH